MGADYRIDGLEIDATTDWGNNVELVFDWHPRSSTYMTIANAHRYPVGTVFQNDRIMVIGVLRRHSLGGNIDFAIHNDFDYKREHPWRVGDTVRVIGVVHDPDHTDLAGSPFKRLGRQALAGLNERLNPVPSTASSGV